MAFYLTVIELPSRIDRRTLRQLASERRIAYMPRGQENFHTADKIVHSPRLPSYTPDKSLTQDQAHYRIRLHGDFHDRRHALFHQNPARDDHQTIAPESSLHFSHQV